MNHYQICPLVFESDQIFQLLLQLFIIEYCLSSRAGLQQFGQHSVTLKVECYLNGRDFT